MFPVQTKRIENKVTPRYGSAWIIRLDLYLKSLCPYGGSFIHLGAHWMQGGLAQVPVAPDHDGRGKL